jgi:uncharacterized protein YjdB
MIKAAKVAVSNCALFTLLLAVSLLSLGCGGLSVGKEKTMIAIVVTPATAGMAVGASQQFTATGTYGDGSTADVTPSVTWTSSSPSIATITTAGMATAVAPGSSTMTATLSGISGAATLTVSVAAKTLSSIAVTPATASIGVGATGQFTATGTYSDGSTAVVTSTATWASSSAAVATINAAGLATAVASGTTTIRATVSGVSGTAALAVTAVTAKTLVSIAVTPAAMSIAAGATEQYTATATYSDGSIAVVTSTATWASSSAAVATVNAAGLATAITPGISTVTATVGGVSGTASLTVTANTVTSIAVTPAAPTIAPGLTEQFTATATYSNGTTANVSSTATWTSSSAAAATIGATGLATAVAAGSTTITAMVGGVSGKTTLTVTGKAITSIAVTPTGVSFAVGATEQFTATATYSDGSTANITSTATWSTGNTSVATISPSGLATGVASGTSSVMAAESGVTGSVAASITLAVGTGVNIPTWHVDANRSGLNAAETSLTTANVAPMSFGKLFSYAVDGYVYGEPLLMSNITVNGAVHNVIYVATEHDSVYAFDADSYGTGAPLWQVSLLQTVGGVAETPVTVGAIQPYLGVTSTPVIDPTTNTIYVVSEQTLAGNSSFRLNALDITTGAQKFGGPVTIQASVKGNNSDAVNGIVSLTTSCIQRAALLLANGNVYMGFGSCHSGWLLSYDASTLVQNGVYNASPNLNGEGQYASAGGVWMGSGGPVADPAGNIYITTGNGPWDGQTAFADSILKFNATLTLQDYFTPDDYAFMDCADGDLAAGGLILIPGTSEVVAGGKTGMMYMANTANLGHESANDAGITQELFWGAGLLNSYSSPCTDTAGGVSGTAMINSYEIFGTPAYFNGSLYLGVTPTAASVPAGVRQFTYSGGMLTPGAVTTQVVQQGTRGTTPFISADGTSNGILWMIDTGFPIQNTAGSGGTTTATLRAYDAANLSSELYNSSTNSTDVPGYGIKFSSPVVGNGKVYISTGHDLTTVTNPQGEIDVYGLN